MNTRLKRVNRGGSSSDLRFSVYRQFSRPLQPRIFTAGGDRHVYCGLIKLCGKTLGFVAFGKIPQSFTELAAGFDFDYLVYDPYLKEAEIEGQPVEKVDFDTLLSKSDIVSVHAPLVNETHHMLDADAFELMRNSAFLINTARGPLIDENALYDALIKDELAGAGLDVMEEEPIHKSPLFELDSVVVTPHVAWYSERSLDELRQKAAENVVRLFQGKSPHGIVNESSLN